MINSKVLLGTVVLAATLLTGCAKEEVNTAVDVAATQLTSLRADVDYAKSEAIRANQRLDNLTVRYKK